MKRMRRKDSTVHNACVARHTRWIQRESVSLTYCAEIHCSTTSLRGSSILLAPALNMWYTPRRPKKVQLLAGLHATDQNATRSTAISDGTLNIASLQNVTTSGILMFESAKDHVVSHGRSSFSPPTPLASQRHRAGLLMFEFRRTSRPVNRQSRAPSGPRHPGVG